MGCSAQNTGERGTRDGNEGSGKVRTAPRPTLRTARFSSAVVLSNLKHWAWPVSAVVQQPQQEQQQQPNMGTQMCGGDHIPVLIGSVWLI